MKKILVYCLIIALTVLAMRMSARLERMVYTPVAEVSVSPAQSSLSFEPFTVQTQDGTQLKAWFIPAAGYENARAALGTVIHLHGRDQNMGAYLHQVDWLAHRGFNVVTMDYRGYGQSGGEPSSKGLQDDIVSLLKTVRANAQLDPDRLVIFAQDLGAAHVIEVLGQGNRAGVRALVVEGAFASYRSWVDLNTRGLGRLVTDSPKPEDWIDRIGVPLMLIHAKEDKEVPYAQAQRLFERASEPKIFLSMEGDTHLGALNVEKNAAFRDKLSAYFTQALNAKIAPPKPD